MIGISSNALSVRAEASSSGRFGVEVIRSHRMGLEVPMMVSDS